MSEEESVTLLKAHILKFKLEKKILATKFDQASSLRTQDLEPMVGEFNRSLQGPFETLEVVRGFL